MMGPSFICIRIQGCAPRWHQATPCRRILRFPTDVDDKTDLNEALLVLRILQANNSQEREKMREPSHSEGCV